MLYARTATTMRDRSDVRSRRYSVHAIAALITAAAVVVSSAANAEPAAIHRVDWKSWLHGDPTPPAKAPPPKQLALVSSAAQSAAVNTDGAAALAQVESFMRAFAAAVMAREGRPLLARLSSRYTIDDVPDDANAADLFLQAIDRIPGPREIVIQSVETRGDDRIAKIEFRYEEKVSLKTFRFDASGKLVSSDLFALKRVHGG